jgi:tRNA nucleotidyltransferase (CCA-adding enzyme)
VPSKYYTLKPVGGGSIIVACQRTDVEKAVLKAVKPGDEERSEASNAAMTAVRLVEDILRSQLPEIYPSSVERVTVEGSFAKDTWLSGATDFDIFILLKREACREETLRTVVEAVRDEARRLGYTVEERYAEHPYVRVEIGRFWAEIVPACSIPPGARPLTAVDRTPHHTRYINSKLTGEQRDEVRLLKSFMKGIGVYGAEIAVEGFSGYLAELLIVAYGCFRSVLEAATRWRPPVVIDVEGHYGSVRSVLERFGRDKPMIVVDPVDPERNVAAAVSLQSLARFILASTLYLSKPSPRFFHIAPKRAVQLTAEATAAAASRSSNIAVIILEPPFKQPPETLWGVGKRVAKLVASHLERWGFQVYWSEATACSEKRIIVALELEALVAPRYELLRGPPAWMTMHAVRFYQKYISSPEAYGPWVGSDGRLYVVRARRYRDALQLLRERLEEWLPGSAKGYTTTVAVLPSLDDELEECERLWLYQRAAERLEDWEMRRE